MFRATRLREGIRKANLQEILAKLKDLRLVATHEKVKAVFFLKIDKFSAMLSLFSSSITNKSLSKSCPSTEEVAQMLDTWIILFKSAVGSSNPQASVHHPIYNYLTGHRLATHSLPLWINSLHKLVKKFQTMPKVLSSLRELCELLLKPQPVPPEGFLQVYSKNWGKMITSLLAELITVPGNQVLEESCWELDQQGKDLIIASVLLAPGQPDKPSIEQALAKSGPGLGPLLQKGLSSLEKTQHLLLFAEKCPLDVFQMLLSKRRSLTQQSSANSSALDYLFVSTLEKMLETRNTELPVVGTNLDKKLTGFARFLLDLAISNPTDEFLLRTFSGLRQTAANLSTLLAISYANLKPNFDPAKINIFSMSVYLQFSKVLCHN